MAKLTLLHRRQVWVPTRWGWLLILLITLGGGVTALFGAYPFLASSDPAPAAKLLVVEGWLADRELDQAIAAFQRGGYEQLVTTGGPIERTSPLVGFSTYADLAAAYLTSHGVPPAIVVAVPAPASAQDRTYLSAVKVREWVRKNTPELRAFDVYSGGPHARRSRSLFALAFGSGVRIGVLSATPSEYDASRWWRSSAGAKSVIGEAIGLAWVSCCFFRPADGSYEEAWGLPRRPASK